MALLLKFLDVVVDAVVDAVDGVQGFVQIGGTKQAAEFCLQLFLSLAGTELKDQFQRRVGVEVVTTHALKADLADLTYADHLLVGFALLALDVDVVLFPRHKILLLSS